MIYRGKVTACCTLHATSMVSSQYINIERKVREVDYFYMLDIHVRSKAQNFYKMLFSSQMELFLLI